MMLPFSSDRIWAAVSAVRSRLVKTISGLESAGVPYALAGDNAVAAWVAQVDPSAVRNTPDVTILIRRAAYANAAAAMASAGFISSVRRGEHVFLDDPTSNRGVRFFFAGEPVISGSTELEPDVTDSEIVGTFCVLNIQAFARLKLTTFRDLDRLNLRDLIEVGLLDQTWPTKFAPELATRLQLLLDTPGG